MSCGADESSDVRFARGDIPGFGSANCYGFGLLVTGCYCNV
jgi:hypothetical protein